MKPRTITASKSMLSLLLASLLLVAGALLPSRGFAQQEGVKSLRTTSEAFRAVAKEVSPAVVFIKVDITANAPSVQGFSPFGGPNDFFRRFFGEPPNSHGQMMPQQKRHEVGQGSGFIVSPDGIILTNNHVVAHADKINVKLLDGREFDAKVLGTDPASDVAVIKIDAKDLPYLKFGNSDKLEVGDWVLAFGNPFGLSHTMTAGIVSAKGRSGIGLNDYENFIQTDAAINPGNSGGPLVNLDGQVVGMNSAIYSRSGGYMGIGFAIPINMVAQVRDQLIKHGKVVRGQLGVYIQQLTKDLADSFGISDAKGLLVSKVIKGTAADKAGIKQGDVIVRRDGQPVSKLAEFRNRIAMTPPGTKVKLDILRDGKAQTVTVVMGTLSEKQASAEGGEQSTSGFGLSLQKLTPDLADQLGYQGQKGVLVTSVDPGSPADDAGIQRGDLIQEVNRQPVTTPDQVDNALAARKGKPALLLVRHGDATRYVALKPNS